jgi:hypothetical protein
VGEIYGEFVGNFLGDQKYFCDGWGDDRKLGGEFGKIFFLEISLPNKCICGPVPNIVKGLVKAAV